MSDKRIDKIDLLIKEDENVLRGIIKNTSSEQTEYSNGVPKDKLISFIGMKIGKIYKDLMMKLNILKMDTFSLHESFQNFLNTDKKYKDANDIDKLNIETSIKDLKNSIGTIEDFENNLK